MKVHQVMPEEAEGAKLKVSLYHVGLCVTSTLRESPRLRKLFPEPTPLLEFSFSEDNK